MKKTIKTYISLLLLFVSTVPSSILFAQQESNVKPNKIEGIAKENKSLSYYQEQSSLWHALVEKEPDYAEGWHYYYKAERAKLQLEQPHLWANDKKAFYLKLSPITNEAKKYIASEFEYHYLMGLNSEGKDAADALKKAYEIDPERSEAYGWLFTHYVPRFKKEQCIDLAKRMLKNNTYSDANLKWNYNALMSVEKDGILISNGDMDGIPKWVLQYGANIRNDVMVTNKWLLATDEIYRNKVYSIIGLDLPKLNKSDFANMSLYVDYLAADILKRSKRPTYISSGTQLKFINDNGLKGKMYLVGNVLKYSENCFNNTDVIIDNFEQKYVLEYLLKNFQQHHEDEMVKTRMNLTYLPGLVHLKNHYQSLGQETKYKHYESLINTIIEESGRKEEVKQWFD